MYGDQGGYRTTARGPCAAFRKHVWGLRTVALVLSSTFIYEKVCVAGRALPPPAVLPPGPSSPPILVAVAALQSLVFVLA